MCSIQKVFLIVSQYSQENTFSCEYCKIFKRTYFEEHLRRAASVAKALIVLLLSFVLFQTYGTFSLFHFHNFTCKFGNKK